MITGITTNSIKKEIQSIRSELKNIDVVNVFGFGSFFRADRSEDVDLLLVLDNQVADPGARYASLAVIFRTLGDKIGVTIDLTVLLESEFEQKLLNEHDSLVDLLQ
ncbi:hypothetical protein WMF11_41760 [Sorangium sp. So ce295]|uniref:hypothetical protein n=1 Tax=Sorangium sp. So ce295 TaxID=3133295 RepID=UPI003F623D2C